MKALVIGSGGREHALAWKLSASDLISEVLVAPGNAGTDREPGIRNVRIDISDNDALVDLAQRESIALTVVGPEDPLVNGVVDAFTAAGLRCFGPNRHAAQLEGSKAYMKDFLERHEIPTAHYKKFEAVQPALNYVHRMGTPIVIKTDGLAAGKGVTIAHTIEEAEHTVRAMLSGQAFGNAGKCIVIEEFLAGEEISFIAMVDGKNILPLASSQDHKARDNKDKGPNTGGMGAYSPVSILNPMLHQRVMNEIMRPTVKGMAKDGHKYTGFLYAGLMIDKFGNPRVLEFNCRFGDPETQPIMMRLQSDFATLCMAACDGQLSEHNVRWDPRFALGVVMAAGGYPLDYEKGAVIRGLEAVDNSNTKVFHAGTAEDNGEVVTAGGRVLCVTALGDTVHEAQQRAYAAAKKISWKDAYYRDDIGYRAVTREQK